MMGFNDEDRREIVKYRLEKSLCTYKGLSKEWFLTDKGEMQKSFVVNHNFVQGELTNILVVVIRYFGGVKLGTSGLIVAYVVLKQSLRSSSTSRLRTRACRPPPTTTAVSRQPTSASRLSRSL